MKKKWNFWIDCGGTFTDIIGIDGQGRSHFHKILSHSPHYESAVVQGIKEVIGHDRFRESLEGVRLGTTVATNAFLERKGIPCALVTTKGHKDILEIRDQSRPRLFDIPIKKIKPFYTDVFEVNERINAKGEVLIPLQNGLEVLQKIYKSGIRSVAISFMHATLNPTHELALKEIALKLGFDYVAISHTVSSRAEYVARTETTVLDASLSPYLRQYTLDLEEKLGIENILYMKSDGGLCRGHELKGYNALLSGPAGGLVGAIEAAKERGHQKIITFDMGGTSTDVAIYDGELKLDHRPKIGGVNLLSPMVDIHTVAAGGGSILSHDGSRFRVGPESAGAFPGPASYGNGGPLTVTDANLFLGNIKPKGFPSVFGPNRDAHLNEEIVREKFEELSKRLGMGTKNIAQGFLDIAVETMVRAIKKVSVERGYDPKDFILVSFGGAGGQLACQVAESLGMKEVYIHPLCSILSALGIGQSYRSLSLQGKKEKGFKPLEKKLKHLLPEGELFYSHLMQPFDSDYQEEIFQKDYRLASEEFKQHYRLLFGMPLDKEPVCDTVMVKSVKRQKIGARLNQVDKKEVIGPKLISENNTTIVIPSDWKGLCDEFGHWSLKKIRRSEKMTLHDERVELEIFYQRFQYIAEQMGFTLERMARSVNIKERKDFSCALFTKEGELIANAPHIPVHLGSMGEVVEGVCRVFQPQKGEMYICNSPLFGGTHLPDVTVVAPVFFKDELVMWVASRGHHADIGGISPGSMPGYSKTLEEEGVIISPLKIMERGELSLEPLKKLLMSSTHPVRNLELNIHDIRAKVSANHKGTQELISLFESYGAQHVFTMCENVLDYSHQKLKENLKDIKSLHGHKVIADNREIRFTLEKEADGWVFDFSGTSPRLNNNFNTPRAVVKAAVLFALRCLIDEDIPLNDGIMRGIKLNIPEDCFLNPSESDAVVAGNVETSQAICDLLLHTLGVMAEGQGTMNNLSFGNETYQYYETLGGGSGACPKGEGASAVQVHMTNSLLTDPEVMETRFPVFVEEMAIRRNSGGGGKFKGGDGLIRSLRFLEPMQVSMISQSREVAPRGLCKGGSGKVGRNSKVSSKGETLLRENFEDQFLKDEMIKIETPGGGGFDH